MLSLLWTGVLLFLLWVVLTTFVHVSAWAVHLLGLAAVIVLIVFVVDGVRRGPRV